MSSSKISYVILTVIQDYNRLSIAKNIQKNYPNFKIFPALFWRTDEEYIKRTLNSRNIVDKRYNNICGKIACWASYIEIFSSYLAMESEYLVVLQDDVIIKPTFEKDLKNNYIDSNYIAGKINSARLGPYLSGAIFHNSFFDRFFKSVRETGIIKPLDHYLVNVKKGYDKVKYLTLMKPPNKRIVSLNREISKISNIQL